MAGLAKTNNFMLGTATVMLGPLADLADLNPADHSIGLVKNFTITSDPAYTELTQGVKNTIVHSILTSNPVRCTMEAYEYTAKNLAYALGLAGDFTAVTEQSTLASAITAGSPAPTTFTVASGDGADFDAGDYVMIQSNALDDFVIRKIASISTDTITVTKTFEKTIPSGSKVLKVQSLGIGSKTEQDYYAAKVTGKLVDETPVAILIPKVRIVRGFNLSFASDDYANMPLEFTVYDQVTTDPFYTEFGGDAARLFRQ